MAPSKKTVQVETKSRGDLFHELWKSNPHQLPNVIPTVAQNCQVLEGQVGTVGSVLFWNYCHDGKNVVAKTITKDINEAKKSLTYEIIEGDLLELYKTFVITIQVDKHGSNSLVTWTVEYEKLNPNVPDPDSLLEVYKKMTKDIETYHLQK